MSGMYISRSLSYRKRENLKEVNASMVIVDIEIKAKQWSIYSAASKQGKNKTASSPLKTDIFQLYSPCYCSSL